MKELWPSLTTVEPATIYPLGQAGRRRKGRRFCGAQKGRNEGRCMRACERTAPHALGMQSSGSGRDQGGRENRRTNCREGKGPHALCGEGKLSSNGDCEMERILLETIELVSPLTKAEEACIRPFIISLVCRWDGESNL